jgi:isoaspartyl peptidase/L-asparaginase-like protein (Ntn-hydrolase superfamily)
MELLVHGGAGSEPEESDRCRRDLRRAVRRGRKRDRPLTAVRAAVRHLESAPRFNAGVGGAVQSDGTVRTDAGIMGSDGVCGAACAMPGVEHAVEVARVVAEETPHVCVAGERAVALAEAFDVGTDRDLWTERTRERWREADVPAPAGGDGGSVRDQLAAVREQFAGTDTVGAVATDGDGLAAATSTGGRWFALAGRVGDVPQVGAGFHASGEAAASATGEGEAIARFGLARRAVEAVADGDDPGTAADRVVRGFAAETGGRAGVIVADRSGRTGHAHNAEAMGTAGTGRR